MVILDRKTAPEYVPVSEFHIQEAVEEKLDNGISCYLINSGIHDLVHIEVICNAGLWHQQTRLAASSVNGMLVEGTSEMSAEKIAGIIDYYGAALATDAGKDFSYITLASLNKFLPDVLPVLQVVISDATFPENELSTYLSNRQQKFKVNSEKVNFIARKKFAGILFGSDHPYGIDTRFNDYDKVQRDDLINFYKKNYHAENFRIIVSGKISGSFLSLLNSHLGNMENRLLRSREKRDLAMTGMDDYENDEKKHFIHKKNAVQSAIRVGRRLFNKTHDDFQEMVVLNTVLGGYFGSRLMSNIREDKGYTYGIHSALISYIHGGALVIASEVGSSVAYKAIDEIFTELQRLCNEPVGKDELMTVKNYILGEFQRSIDGPFALADRFKGIMEYGLGYDYYNNFIHTVQNITPERLLELANLYLKPEEMFQLIVGEKSV